MGGGEDKPEALQVHMYCTQQECLPPIDAPGKKQPFLCLSFFFFFFSFLKRITSEPGHCSSSDIHII